MFEAFIQALANIVRPDIFLVIVLATIVSVIIGIIPAITGGAMSILILPFLFGVDPVISLPILCALFAVSNMGGSITTVLLGVPGDPANAATLLDGFGMTRKGQSGRAVGLALTSNILGGLMGVILAFALIPIVIPFVMRFKSPEMLLIIVLALMFVGVLTERSRIKGLISGAFGLLLSCIGYQTATGVARLTFGNLHLYDGINMVTALLGILAVPMLLELHAAGTTIAPPDTASAGKLKELLKGGWEIFRHHKWLWFRSTVIGYIVGVMPALGSSSAVWIAYGQAKKTSKEPDQFGKGSPEGIIAPESANSACHPGDLITTLSFGIPGSGGMVILLAAFLMAGIQPGPKLLFEHTTVAFTMLLAVAVANIIAGILCFLGSPVLIKVTRVSPAYIFAYLIPILCLAAFVSREHMMNLLVLGIVSLIGVFISSFGYSAPAMILGFILGDLFERYLWLSLSIYGPVFFTSPISIALVCLIVVILIYDPLKRVLRRKSKESVKGAL